MTDPGGQQTDSREQFIVAYDEVLAGSPIPLESINLTSHYGVTRVHAAGPEGAPSILLMHSYQATSAQWLPLMALLSNDHRVFAVDMMGDAGHSIVGSTSISTPEELNAYLDTVLDGLGLTSTELCGHSFGAWIALSYSISRPSRVDRLTLLDPTMTFGPLVPPYVIRALPALSKPSSARRLSLIRWETRKAELDPKWLRATGLAADAFGGLPTVPTKIPSKEVLAKMDRPVLVIMAGKSRVHAVRGIAGKADNRLPHVLVKTLPNATHYALPLTHATDIADLMRS